MNKNFNANVNANITLTVIAAIAALFVGAGILAAHFLNMETGAVICFAIGSASLFVDFFILADREMKQTNDKVFVQIMLLAISMGIFCALVFFFIEDFLLYILIAILIVLGSILLISFTAQELRNENKRKQPCKIARMNTMQKDFPNNRNKKRPPQEKIW